MLDVRDPTDRERRRLPRDTAGAVGEPWLAAVGVFFGVASAVVIGVVLAARAAGVSLGAPDAFGYLLAALWAPTIGRVAARLTVDRGRPAPMPLFGPSFSLYTLALPVSGVLAVYGTAYGAAALMGDVSWAGPWAEGGRRAADVGRTLGAVLAIGSAGAIGAELGWRGWLQPRLDRAGIRGSMPIVVLLETLLHVPLIVGLGYATDGGLVVGILMFGLLKLGATPLWTWAQYRQRTVWAAVGFHAAHSVVAQDLAPRLFVVEGPAWMVGETGVLPIIAYLGASLAVLGLLWARGGSFSGFARWSLGDSVDQGL